MNKHLRKSIRKTISGMRSTESGLNAYNCAELQRYSITDMPVHLMTADEREEFAALIAECKAWQNKIYDHYMMEACSLSGLESHFYGTPQYDAVSCSTDYLDSARNCISLEGTVGDVLAEMNDAIDYLLAAIE